MLKRKAKPKKTVAKRKPVAKKKVVRKTVAKRKPAARTVVRKARKRTTAKKK